MLYVPLPKWFSFSFLLFLPFYWIWGGRDLAVDVRWVGWGDGAREELWLFFLLGLALLEIGVATFPLRSKLQKKTVLFSFGE